jgi:hypothetical protein
MRLGARSVGAIVGAGLWIGLSEFLRNQLLLAAVWRDHFASLGLVFPSDPVNAAVWMLWSFVFGSLLFCVSRKFTLVQTAALGWVAGFLMMWFVVWNLDVLPLAALPFAVPLSLLESFVASYICVKVAPPSAT